jgi:hypothetical protein
MITDTRIIRLAALLTTVLLTPYAHSHDVVPGGLEIMGIGKTKTFTVTDPTGCTATMTAVPSDPAIVSVTPPRVERSAQQTFTVTALRAGDTQIEVRWVGDNPPECAENATTLVAVKVLDAPDLTITVTTPLPGCPWGAFANNIVCVRIGMPFPMFTTITNLGSQPSSGPIAVLSPWINGDGRGFDSCGQGQCLTSRSIAPGDAYANGILELVLGPGLSKPIGIGADVTGGGDVKPFNNFSNTIQVAAIDGRKIDDSITSEDVRIVTGRKRPGER